MFVSSSSDRMWLWVFHVRSPAGASLQGCTGVPDKTVHHRREVFCYQQRRQLHHKENLLCGNSDDLQYFSTEPSTFILSSFFTFSTLHTSKRCVVQQAQALLTCKMSGHIFRVKPVVLFTSVNCLRWWIKSKLEKCVYSNSLSTDKFFLKVIVPLKSKLNNILPVPFIHVVLV